MVRRLLFVPVLILWLFCAQHPAAAYLIDALVYLPLDYFTFLPPALGGTYVDQIFGTRVKRITDARNTPDSSNAGNRLTFIRTEYSTMSPFNNTATRLLLQHQGYYGLYDGAGTYLADLPFEINTETEPRWSRSDPNVLYYHPINGNQLKQYNVATAATSVVHTFGEYATIKGSGESDISFDGNKFVLIGDQHDIFVYTLSTDTKGPVFDITGLGSIDQVQITPDNHVLVGWVADGLNRYNGIEMYDQTMNFVRQVAPAINHYDVMRDLNGDEIMVWANANDPNPVCTNGVVKVRLADASQTCLLSLDWSMAIHVSGSDGGWVFVGTYDPSNPNPLLPGAWKPYTNELLQIKLDGSEIRRLAHHRSRPFPGNTYNWTPRASASRDGTKLVYSSDYSLQQLLGYPNDYVDVYMLDGLDSRTGGGEGPPGGDVGCFIATAAFGSPLASEVQTLRAVRDRFLLTSVPGRLFIAAYYRISPPLARAIAAHDWLRSATRGVLRPLVWWARLSLDSPAAAAAVGIVCLSAVPIILFMPRRARRRDS
jgi:hypothetical protein